MTPIQTDKPDLPCPAEWLIPHRSPMLLIDQLVERSDDNAAAITSLKGKSLFHDPGKGITPEFLVEILAQTIAAANGFDGLVNNEKPKAGFVVGLDNFHLTNRDFSTSQLRTEVEKVFEFGEMTIFQGELFCGKLLLASGKIKVWEKQEEA